MGYMPACSDGPTCLDGWTSTSQSVCPPVLMVQPGKGDFIIILFFQFYITSVPGKVSIHFP